MIFQFISHVSCWFEYKIPPSVEILVPSWKHYLLDAKRQGLAGRSRSLGTRLLIPGLFLLLSLFFLSILKQVPSVTCSHHYDTLWYHGPRINEAKEYSLH